MEGRVGGRVLFLKDHHPCLSFSLSHSTCCFPLVFVRWVIFLDMASCSNSLNFAFQPHKSGKPLQSTAKVIVLNVYIKLREQNPGKSENGIIQLSAELTGVSERSIFKIISEMKKNGKVSTPGKKRPLKENTQTRERIYDDFTKTAIRRKVHAFFFKNEIPTAHKVMLAINEDDDLPNISTRTVRNLMHDLGFVFKKRRRCSMLMEREDIQQWRRKYLRDIKRYRSEGREIYYTDETWVNFGHTKEYVWQDTSIKSHRQAFLSGLSPGLKSPSGKGGRLIVIHAGNENGFVLGSDEVFKAKKETGDYHGEMNGVHYEDWFVKKLLPQLKPNSIIVMDNASYHSVHVEQIPTSKTKKADIQAWLAEKGINYNSDMIKVELLQLVAENKKKYAAYRIDEIAAEQGHTVLRLPPYHCELNPIELVWSQVKGHVSANNRSFKVDEVMKLTCEGIQNVSVASWDKCVAHVIKEEKKMWELDGLADNTIDAVQFTVGDSSDDTELYSYSDDDDSLNGTL